MRKKAGLYMVIFLLAGLLRLSGQHLFHHLDGENGLSQNTVMDIVQDNNGFIWMATQDGLNRYDGYQFKGYFANPTDSFALRQSWINCLSFDAQRNRLWIGTRYGGLNYLDIHSNQFHHYLHAPHQPNSLADNTIEAILLDHQGQIWVGQPKGISLLQPEKNTFNHIELPGNSFQNGEKQIVSMMEDRDGTLWLGSSNGYIYSYHPKSKTAQPYAFVHEFTQTHTAVTEICAYGNRFLFVATTAGLRLFDKDRKQFTSLSKEFPCLGPYENQCIYEAFLEDVGKIWFQVKFPDDAIQLVCCHLEQNRNEIYTPNDNKLHQLSNENLKKIFKDKTGVIWLGNNGKGCDYFDSRAAKFKHLTKGPSSENLLGNEYVYSLLEDENRQLWIGTSDAGINVLDLKTGQMRYISSDFFSDKRVSVIEDAGNNQLWVGFNSAGKGDLILLNKTSGNYQAFYGRKGDHKSPNEARVKSILVSRNGKVYIGTNGGGLNVYDPQKDQFEYFTHSEQNENSPADNVVNDIVEDSDGTLWLATGNGLDHFNPFKNTFQHLKGQANNASGLSNNVLLSLHLNAKRELWIGTCYGLNMLHIPTRKISSFTPENTNLPNHFIYGILEDKHGNLWISTNNGLGKFDPLSHRCKTYAVSDGLQNKEFNTHAYEAGNSGYFYFGGINGLNIFHPDSIKDLPVAPYISLTAFKKFEQHVSFQESINHIPEITLEHSDNHFSFNFMASDFLYPKQNRFKCKLEGFNESWIDLGNKNSISYTNLDPGHYTLKIMGSNRDGVWSLHPKEIKITVLPPFYKTWWFRICAGAILIGSIYLLYRRRVNLLIQAKTQLELKVKERTRLIENQKEQIQASHHKILKLSESVKAITASLHTEEIIIKTGKNIKDLFDGDGFGIAIYNEKNDYLSYKRIFEHQKNRTFDIESLHDIPCLERLCIQQRKDIYINDPTTWQALYTDFNDHKTFEFQSLMMVPLLVKNQVIGLIAVFANEAHRFPEENLNLLHSLASFTAIGLDNAKAYLRLNQAKEDLEKLSFVASETINGVVIADKDGTIEWVNEGFVRMTGYSYAEYIQTYGQNLIDASSNERFKQLFLQAMKDKQPFVYEVLNLTKDQREIWVQTTVSPILDAEQHIRKIVVIDTEITELKKAEYELQQQKNETEAKNKDITDSIQYAKRIQNALLTSQKYFEKNWKDSFIFHLPKDIVSGDFYWMSKTSDQKLVVTVADCTGHGVPGAFMSVVGVTKLNEIIIERQISDPAQILGLLRAEIIRCMNPDNDPSQKESMDGMDMALCTFDLQKMEMVCACANNPVWIVRNEELIEIHPDKFPVGAHYGELKPFTNQKFSLLENDMVYLFSDGFADQFGGEKGKKFKYKQLAEHLLQLSKSNGAGQQKQLSQIFNGWKGSLDQVDDVCVIGIRV